MLHRHLSNHTHSQYCFLISGWNIETGRVFESDCEFHL